MTLDQIEAFRRVARLGSFTAAAERLNLTQSTISARIAELERTLGAQLLDRSRHGANLTAKGREFLNYAEKMAVLVEEARISVASPELLSGTIRVGVAELVALTALPRMVAQFRTLFPRVKMELEIGLTGAVLERLATGRIEIGVIGLRRDQAKGLSMIPVGEAELAFLAAPSLPQPLPPITPLQLSELPLIELGPGSQIASAEEEWFATHRARPSKLNRSNSMEISAGLVRSGLGVALLPAGHYAKDIAQGALIRLDVRPPPTPMRFYAVHPEGAPSALAVQFAKIAKDCWPAHLRPSVPHGS